MILCLVNLSSCKNTTTTAKETCRHAFENCTRHTHFRSVYAALTAKHVLISRIVSTDMFSEIAPTGSSRRASASHCLPTHRSAHLLTYGSILKVICLTTTVRTREGAYILTCVRNPEADLEVLPAVSNYGTTCALTSGHPP